MIRKFLLRITISAVIIIMSAGLLFAWGVWGHQHINHAAVLALPEEMRFFYYNHIDFITEEAPVPDIRKYVMNDKNEFARHYIDLEAFGDNAVDDLPRTPEEAYKKFPNDTLQKYGILPWYIQEMMKKLTTAFKDEDKAAILILSADLGHYLGDANMPLHTSLNHNGQLTGQKGIHGFWESQLPEMFGDSYNFKVEPAKYINDITAETWAIIKHSHSLADTLLLTDQQLKETFPKDKIYKLDSTGKVLQNRFGQPVFAVEYAKAYHDALHGMVENQMRRAIQDIANFWYTAWVNAGKPDLNQIDTEALTKANSKNYKMEMKLIEKGKLFNFYKTRNEY